MKNPQTTIALTFLTHIISDIDGVMDLRNSWHTLKRVQYQLAIWMSHFFKKRTLFFSPHFGTLPHPEVSSTYWSLDELKSQHDFLSQASFFSASHAALIST